jgi:nucleoside-diphosphate-sugar epimerase
LLAAYASDRDGLTLNASTNVDTTLTELVRCMLDAAGRSDLKPVYRADSRAVKSYTSQKLCYSNKRAAETIGWTPKVSVREGVERYMRWRDSMVE